MIRYNMRHRGAFEYDKFVLNIMQYNNLINYLTSDVEEENSFSSLRDLEKEINLLLNKTKETNINVYKKHVMIRKK